MLFFCVLAGSSCALSAQSTIPEQLESVPVSTAVESSLHIGQVYSAIYNGEFSTARKLLGQADPICAQSFEISQLGSIVSSYEAIQEERELARKAAYQKQLGELEKLEAGDVNDVNDKERIDLDELEELKSVDINDINDVNSVNGISKILLVIRKAIEFADEEQKRELLSQPFVKETFEKARLKADEFEAKSKWLDAYLVYYGWMVDIYPDNESYSEYAEELIEKANIVASFKNTSWESREQRYEGIKKEMFIRAIDILSNRYVNSYIDYRQMVRKGIKRCKLFAEVVRNPNLEDDAKYEISEGQFKAWLSALNGIVEEEVNKTAAGVSRDAFLDIFEKVLMVNKATVRLPEQVVISQFSEAAFSVLDPYTVMIWPHGAKEFEKQMTNEFTGIGIHISKKKGQLTAVSLLPETPAYNSGLDAGDVIVAVDGVETKGMSTLWAVSKITGPAGTDVTLTIKRPGEEKKFDITITRAKITIPTIYGWQRTKDGKWLYLIDEKEKIGYIRIVSFSENTSADLEKVLRQLESEGMKGLILDLRFNTGGLLTSAVDVTDKFISKGTIVRTRPRFWIGGTHERASSKGTHPDYPLVVLINSGSASASEIVSGALADAVHERAILVGDRTVGKGSVQTITHRPGGGAQLKYTMAYYHLPSDQRVESQETAKKRGSNEWGVGPDVEVKLRSDESVKMADIQWENSVLFKPDHDSGKTPPKKYSAQETIASDPQLATGILIIKTKLIESSSQEPAVSCK